MLQIWNQTQVCSHRNLFVQRLCMKAKISKTGTAVNFPSSWNFFKLYERLVVRVLALSFGITSLAQPRSSLDGSGQVTVYELEFPKRTGLRTSSTIYFNLNSGTQIWYLKLHGRYNLIIHGFFSPKFLSQWDDKSSFKLKWKIPLLSRAYLWSAGVRQPLSWGLEQLTVQS